MIYKNIIEFVEKNNLQKKVEGLIGRPIKNFPDYLDDYSDRNIVRDVLFDLDIKAKVYKSIDWRNQKIETK